MERMQRRTGPIRDASVAQLKDFRLVFNNTDTDGVETYANIMPTPGGVVWGVVYRCAPAALAALDEYECVSDGCYSREVVEVQTAAGEQLQAQVYVGGERFMVEGRRPSDWYLQIILSGANEHGLPEEYVREIELLANPAGPPSPPR
jgi:cation transport regulator ChaC